MAEKEASYETATGGQKPGADTAAAAVLHLPSLTSKPTRAHNNKQQEAEGAKADSTSSSPGGYYLNVAQKGKLILPTALWILLILAGVAFLGLLASLSRTIDTLDTLVELEQEKEARASISEQLARRRVHSANRVEPHHKHREHEHKQRPTTDDESLRRRHHHTDGDLDFSDAGVLLPRASWFSLPSWTSLEPVRPETPLQHPDEVKMLPVPDGVTIEIAGDGGPMPPVGMINSIMSQVMPMLDGLMGPPPPVGPAHRPVPMQQVSPPPPSPPEDDLGAIISAKIDNLNINLNAAQSEQRTKHKISSSREDEIKSLESSVDDLVAKLMAQKLARNGGELDALELGAHHLRAPKVDEIMPVIRVPPASHHVNLMRPSSALSPLASLLGGAHRRPLTMGGADDSPPTMIFGPFNGPADALESMLAQGGPMAASGELNRHGLSNTRRPAPGSPYELTHPIMSGGGGGGHLMPLLDSFKDLDEMIKKQDSAIPPAREPIRKQKPDAEWEVLSNDLADALVQGAIGAQQQQQQQKPSGLGATASLPKPESVVVVNGKQLEGDERDKFLSSIFGPASESASLGASASETKSPLGDLMSAMFEPIRATTTGKQSDATPRPRTTAGPSSEVSGSVSPPAAATMPSTTTSPTGNLAPTAAAASDANSPADMVNDLLSSMFAMPQFGGASSPQQAPSGAPSASGSSSPAATAVTLESGGSSLATTNTEASVSTHAPSVTAPESSMLSTLIEALHTPHVESELAKDSLLREFLGVSSPKETETAQQQVTTTTTAVPTTTTPVSPTTTTTPVGRASGAQVIREQDAPSNMPIFDLGPYARSTSPSIETLKESSSPTPAPSTTAAPVSAASSTGAPITSRTPTIVATSSQVDSTSGKNSTTEPLSKSFLQKADDFLERNLMNFKRFF